MTETDGGAEKRRHFHGRRQGRKLRAGRAALIDALLPQLTVALPEQGGALDPAALFPRPPRELWVEIGFGAGEHLAWQAAHHPDIGFIGCEPFINGMATLLAAVERDGLDMVRVWPDDARPLLDRLPDGSVGRLFLLFADPWPKLRHHNRRFIQDDTVADLARLLKDGGELRIATDDAPLLDWSLERVRRNPAFAWTAEGPADWRERPADWPPTRYEEKALHGRPYYLRFKRRPRG